VTQKEQTGPNLVKPSEQHARCVRAALQVQFRTALFFEMRATGAKATRIGGMTNARTIQSSFLAAFF
jgi:hypothetical protein